MCVCEQTWSHRATQHDSLYDGNLRTIGSLSNWHRKKQSQNDSDTKRRIRQWLFQKLNFVEKKPQTVSLRLSFQNHTLWDRCRTTAPKQALLRTLPLVWCALVITNETLSYCTHMTQNPKILFSHSPHSKPRTVTCEIVFQSDHRNRSEYCLLSTTSLSRSFQTFRKGLFKAKT